MFKKIFFALLILISSQTMAAHYTVSVKGTIVDTIGDGVAGVKVEVTAKTAWGSLIYYNTVLTDRVGQFADSFVTNVSGYLRITASDESFGTVDTIIPFSVSQPMVSPLIEVIRGADPCVASFLWQPNEAVAGQIDFINTSVGGFTEVSYDFGDGSGASSNDPSHLFVPGNHQVCLTISSPSGCVDKRCETINVADPATCNVEFTYSQTVGYEVVLQATTTSPLVTEFTWFMGEGLQTTGKVITHNFSAPGIYTITVYAIDESGCEDTHSGQIEVVEVIDPCKAAFRFIPDPQNPNYFHFTDHSSGDVQSWEWRFGDGSSASVTNPHHLYEQSGNYDVSLKISNPSTGCNDSVTMPVDVGLGYYFTIAGQVFAGGFPADSSQVEVYRINDGLPVFAGVFTSGPYGIFHFYALTQGVYILKASLKSTSPDYGKYLTTYYRKEAFWESARKINLLADSTSIAFDLMPNSDMATGTGTINGHIFYQMTGAMRSEIPAGYVPILLYNEGRDPIHGVFSLEDGYFEFEKVPVGKWNLQPEITGLSIDPFEVMISNDSPGQSNLIVTVVETGVTFGIGINEPQQTITAGTPYPNPSSGSWSLTVNAMEAGNLSVRLFSTDGRIVAAYDRVLISGANQLSFSSEYLAGGLYFVVIQDDNKGKASHKLFIK